MGNTSSSFCCCRESSATNSSLDPKPAARKAPTAVVATSTIAVHVNKPAQKEVQSAIVEKKNKDPPKVLVPATQVIQIKLSPVSFNNSSINEPDDNVEGEEQQKVVINGKQQSQQEQHRQTKETNLSPIIEENEVNQKDSMSNSFPSSTQRVHEQTTAETLSTISSNTATEKIFEITVAAVEQLDSSSSASPSTATKDNQVADTTLTKDSQESLAIAQTATSHQLPHSSAQLDQTSSSPDKTAVVQASEQVSELILDTPTPMEDDEPQEQLEVAAATTITSPEEVEEEEQKVEQRLEEEERIMEIPKKEFVSIQIDRNFSLDNLMPVIDGKECSGVRISEHIPNFKELMDKVMREFHENIQNQNSSSEKDGYKKEIFNEYTFPNGGTKMHSRVFLKPVQERGHKYFKIRSDYNLFNVDALDYLLFTMDPVRSKANNSSIDQFETLGVEDGDYHLIYISYKKVLILSPRDFIYIKCNKKIDDHTYVTVQISVECDKVKPVFKGTERGNIVISGCLLQNYQDEKGRNGLNVLSHTETDLNLSLAHRFTQGLTGKQVNSFITTLQDKFDKNTLKAS